MKKELEEVFEELKKTDPEGTKRRGKMAVEFERASRGEVQDMAIMGLRNMPGFLILQLHWTDETGKTHKWDLGFNPEGATKLASALEQMLKRGILLPPRDADLTDQERDDLVGGY